MQTFNSLTLTSKSVPLALIDLLLPKVVWPGNAVKHVSASKLKNTVNRQLNRQMNRNTFLYNIEYIQLLTEEMFGIFPALLKRQNYILVYMNLKHGIALGLVKQP